MTLDDEEGEPEIEPLKSARHHWWPECVSQHWNDERGCCYRISATGEVIPAPAKNWGILTNAHIIKHSADGSPTVWDYDFERAFDAADSALPFVIQWLNALNRTALTLSSDRKTRLLPQPVSDEEFRNLVEGIVSLAVRSPRFRETAVALAEHYRGRLPPTERRSLIGSNLMHCQRRIADCIGLSGKVAVLFSPAKEFIFGDGFYHNLSSSTQVATGIRMVVPLTPNVTVLFAVPRRYLTEPRLATMVLRDDEVSFFNDTVQVYAKDWIFFRRAAPKTRDDFKEGTFKMYSAPDPMDAWVNDLAGLSPRTFLRP